MKNYSVDVCHEKYMKLHSPLLKYDQGKDYVMWKEQVKKKLVELLGDMPARGAVDFKVEWEKEHATFEEYRIIFLSEDEVEVPCHLWVPRKVSKPCPVIICLQGHSTGMHISMGEKKYEGDDELIADGDRDFARQIIREGYAALILEQRAFGERKSERQLDFTPDADCTCTHPAMVALLMGRTLIGERVWDVSRAIDMLENFPMIDIEKVAIMGNSGGGTVAYYAACMDERIKIAMPSCSVCSYKYSITAMRHCPCNYIPGIAKYFDMGDLACLIAPRKLIVVAGAEDDGFLIEGVKEVYSTIEKIYKRAGVADHCKLIIGDGEHRFYAKLSWPVFREVSNW